MLLVCIRFIIVTDPQRPALMTTDIWNSAVGTGVNLFWFLILHIEPSWSSLSYKA